MTFKKNKEKILTARNELEINNIQKLKEFHLSEINNWGVTWNKHSALTLQRNSVSRILHLDNMYKKIVGVAGSILEFGVQWGATLAQLIALRGIYEPYNYRRHIFGFDTFEGFKNTHDKIDGTHVEDGDYSVNKNYEKKLENILQLHEQGCPLSHIKKFTLIKGDASLTSKQWLIDYPHAVISMAIFDMDIYKPTRDALEAIIPRLTKGSVLIFDEINCEEFPGETKAIDDVLELNKLKLNHNPNHPSAAWTIWEN
jgi:hypothetical protein